jgi:hypothetical protein
MAYRKEANLYLRYSSSNYYIRQCHLGPARKPNIIPTPVKKLKLYIVATKLKKRPIATSAIIDKTNSGEEISLVDESGNE